MADGKLCERRGFEAMAQRSRMLFAAVFSVLLVVVLGAAATSRAYASPLSDVGNALGEFLNGGG